MVSLVVVMDVTVSVVDVMVVMTVMMVQAFEALLMP